MNGACVCESSKRECGDDEYCTNGVCVCGGPFFPACGAGEDCVDGRCICGGEGRACWWSESCCEGACVPSHLDEANCGGCDYACPAGEECREGVCESPAFCPEGTAHVEGYCWSQATDCLETPAETCARFGLEASPWFLPMEWDGAHLAEVADGIGCNSIGEVSCCVPSMWVDPSGDCFTMGFGDQFENFLGCALDDAIPVRTCSPR